MKQFIGTKLINARPAKRSEVDTMIMCFRDEEGATNSDEGYLVEYLDSPNKNTEEFDNYVSWSPKDVFERAYKSSGELSFGDAIAYLKLGFKVKLPYWSDDVFISIQKPTVESKMTAEYLYVTSRYGLVPWNPTQIEILSENWEIIS